jgi:Secretion system C-terminal sorting domain
MAVEVCQGRGLCRIISNYFPTLKTWRREVQIRSFLSMKICFLIFLLLAFSQLPAQFSFETNLAGMEAKYKHTISSSGTCATSELKGSKGKSSVDLIISLPINVSPNALADAYERGLIKFIENTVPTNVADILGKLNVTPQFNCDAVVDILHIGGQVDAYAINPFHKFIVSNGFSGKVSYQDKIQVVSPIATTIELPFEISASLVAFQSFCPPGSNTYAKANLTARLGFQSASLSDSVPASSDFLFGVSSATPKKKGFVRLVVPQGTSTFPLDISGGLAARALAQGLSPIDVVTCAASASARVGNSIIVRNFTGINGTPLPANIKITGLITGVNYTDLKKPKDCSSLPTPQIKVNNASCNIANGSATVSGLPLNQYKYEWSNGATATTAFGFPVGAHYAIIKDTAGCSRTLFFEVQDTSRPVVLLPKETTLIKGNSVTLNAQDTTGGFYRYKWSTGETTSSIIVQSPGSYRVTMTNNAFCTFIYNTQVVEKDGVYISDGNIQTDSSTFYDDGGPNVNYSANQNRVVSICPESPEKYTTLEFVEVDILSSNQDELSIFDGIGTICPLSVGLKSPSIFTASASAGGCLTVRFRSTNFDGEGKGWKALIRTSDTPSIGCYSSINSCDTTFYDTGGALGEYKPKEYSVLYVCPPASEKSKKYISVEFTELEIGAGDHLAVYDGRGVYCILNDSVERPQRFLASIKSDGCLTIVFDSDSLQQKAGWKAKVVCDEAPGDAPENCSCGINPPPSNTCDLAPILNNLEPFCGETSVRYTADITGNLGTVFSSCGIIHNNSFIKFIPSSSTVKIGYKSRGGTHKLCSGFQLAVLRNTGNCTAATTFWQMVKCLNIDGGLSADGVFEVGGLLVGQTYYIMIDGSFGSECLYSLVPLSGFVSCKINVEQEEIVCNEDGTYHVKLPIKGAGSGAVYTISEKNNFLTNIKEVAFVDNVGTKTFTVGPYPPGLQYDILISGGESTEACSLNIKGQYPCSKPCNMELDISTQCLADNRNILLKGVVKNGATPISIFSDVIQSVLFPEDSNRFQVILPKESVGKSLIFRLTDLTNCRLETESVVPSCSVSTQTGKNIEKISLQPNPTNGIVSIDGVDTAFFPPVLHDISGRMVHPGLFKVEYLDTGLRLNLTALPQGLYFLTFQNHQSIITKKVIKL